MVKYYSLDATFGALSHPIRRAILARLARGEAAVTELAAPFHISLPALLKHLRILGQVGLITNKKAGRVHTCRLNAAPMQQAAEWLAFYETFWNNRLDALGEYLEGTSDSGQT